MFFASLAILGSLGFAFGRRWGVTVVFLLPIAFWWHWASANEKGPDDDVTGPAAAFLMAVSIGCVLIGVVTRWLVYWIAWVVHRAG